MAAVSRLTPVRSIPALGRRLHTFTRNTDEYNMLRSKHRVVTASDGPQLMKSLHTSTVFSGSRRKKRGGQESLPRNCPSCAVPLTDIEKFEGYPRFIKCNNCLHLFCQSSDITAAIPLMEEPRRKTPKELKAYLDKHVVGQDLAKKILSLAMYNHYKIVKHNIPAKKPSRDVVMDTPKTLYFPDGLRNLSKENIAETLQRQASHLNTLGYPGGKAGKGIGAAAGEHAGHEASTGTDHRPEITKIDKTNILMIGPTGSGKTLMAQKLANILDVPFAICDCTTLTAAGYVGDDVESVIAKLLQNAGGDVEKCEQGIVFLDEIDKLAKARLMHTTRDVGGEGVQQAMLKVLEGTTVSVPEKSGRKMHGSSTVNIDTTNILFIGAGAFSGLEKIVQQRLHQKTFGFGAAVMKPGGVMQATSVDMDMEDNQLSIDQIDECYRRTDGKDLMDFGLIPEFVGRFQRICPFHSLTEHMLVQVLVEPQNALVKQYKKTFSLDECLLEITDGALAAIASAAVKKKTGARGLRSELETHLLSAMYEIPGANITKVIINDEVITNNAQPSYITDIDLSDTETTKISVRDVNLNVTKSEPKVTSVIDTNPPS